jgi:hypothetical protein
MTEISIWQFGGLALVRFDLATIPKKAAVKKATLTLKLISAGFSAEEIEREWPVEVFECKQAWKEGDGTNLGPTNVSGATKSTYDGVAKWPGENLTSALGTVLGTTIITKGREPRSFQWDLDVATVQGWISGERENNGMAIWGKAPGKAVAFASSEHKDPRARPVLTLTLDVPEPIPASIARFVVSPVSWADFIANCGRKASEQNDARSAKIFRETYQGRVVVWSGVVAMVKERLVGGGYQIGITMSPTESLLGSSDVTLFALAEQRDTALALNKGDKVSFVGTITRQGGMILDHTLDMIDITRNPTDDD